MDFGFGENDGARWSGALDFGKSKKEPRDGKSNKRGRDDDVGATERPSKMQKGRNGKVHFWTTSRHHLHTIYADTGCDVVYSGYAF